MGMKSMYELRDMLCKELDELIRKGELGAGDLDIAHKLTDTIKNIDKIEAMDERGYSGRYLDDDLRGYSRGSSSMPVGITSEAITAATTAGRPCAVSFGICWTMPMMIPFVARSSAAWTPWRDKGVRPHDR